MGVRKESKAGCCDTLSHTGMDVRLFCLGYSQGRHWEPRSGPACHPSWPGVACNSLLPSSFSWRHILIAAQDVRMGATDALQVRREEMCGNAALATKKVGGSQELPLPLWPGRAGALTQPYRRGGWQKWLTSRTPGWARFCLQLTKLIPVGIIKSELSPARLCSKVEMGKKGIPISQDTYVGIVF